MGTVPAVLEAAARFGLDLIAITDHDEVRGALKARDLAHRYGVHVVPGVEVATAEGHLLALFVEETPQRGLALEATLGQIGELGGLAIAAHPTARWVHSLGADTIRRALRDRDAARVLVAIEAYNAGLPRLSQNHAASLLAAETGLACVANTDSHMLWTIGLCSSHFPGVSPEHLRAALLARMTRPIINQRPGNWLPSFATQQVLRRLGWAHSAPQPGMDAILTRLSRVK